MPPPASNPDLSLFDLEKVCQSQVGNLPSKFGHDRSLGSRIIRYVCNEQTDRQKQCLLPVSLWVGEHNYMKLTCCDTVSSRLEASLNWDAAKPYVSTSCSSPLMLKCRKSGEYVLMAALFSTSFTQHTAPSAAINYKWCIDFLILNPV